MSARSRSIMLREADARLAAEKAAEEKARLAQIADAARLANTRRAKAQRRVEKALKILARMVVR
jgi:hypothetical protein